MVEQSSGQFKWLSSILQIPKESVFKRLKYFLAYMILYALIVSVIEYKFSLNDKYNIQLGQFHLLFSFCLAIIIAFRINTAYYRWWEARTHLGGMVNNLRNLTIKFNNFAGFSQEQILAQSLINLPFVIKAHLRNNRRINNVNNSPSLHSPIFLLSDIHAIINSKRICGAISFEQYMALDGHIANLIDIVGSCEKILFTPLPIAFSLFVRVALVFYMLVFPFGWAQQFGFFIIPVMIVIIYVLLGMEFLAEEMEEPFGKECNDLPLETITNNLSQQVEQIICYQPQNTQS